MFIVKKKTFNWVIKKKFQHSDNTIFYMFYKVFILLLYFHLQIVNLPINDNALYLQITDNIKDFPYFQDCLGALNGIHISVHILAIDSAAYCNQKRALL